jgi:hypothetical protein
MSNLTNIAAIGARPARAFPGKDRRHRIWIAVGAIATAGLTVWLSVRGFDYYLLDQASRPHSLLHRELRPGSTLGLRLGMLGFACFIGIYLYPLRKRWPWLMMKGKTTRWLDYHVLLGIAAPIIISFHATFKASGVAGFAYWTMIALTSSGLIGRFLYSQIPRGLDSARSLLEELDGATGQMISTLTSRGLGDRDYRSLLDLPLPAEVHAMSVLRAFFTIGVLDCSRVFGTWRARRHAHGLLPTVFGMIPSGDWGLEQALLHLRKRALLAQKMLFLSKTQRVFYLWHVIHRPFSMSFALLVLIHVAVVVSLGYF